jgi:hypothetical protein
MEAGSRVLHAAWLAVGDSECDDATCWATAPPWSIYHCRYQLRGSSDTVAAPTHSLGCCTARARAGKAPRRLQGKSCQITQSSTAGQGRTGLLLEHYGPTLNNT